MTRVARFSSLVAEILEVGEPHHVEALVLVEGHALDEGAEGLVNAVTFQILNESGLNTLIKRGEVGASVHADLTLEPVQLLLLSDIAGHLHAVEVNLSVDSGGLNDHATLSTGVSHINGEVAVVLGLRAIVLTVLLFFAHLLVIRDRLSKQARGAINFR